MPKYYQITIVSAPEFRKSTNQVAMYGQFINVKNGNMLNAIKSLM